MSQVGGDAPFDFMYRGEYLPEKNEFQSVELGVQDNQIEVDMVNIDMDSFLIRIYDLAF